MSEYGDFVWYFKNCFRVFDEICKYWEVFESVLMCLSVFEDFDNSFVSDVSKIVENGIVREIDLLDSDGEGEDINGNDRLYEKWVDSGIGLSYFLFYLENGSVNEKGVLLEDVFLLLE